MEATIDYTINIPTRDESLLRSLVERMGWGIKTLRAQHKVSRLDAAIKAAHEEPLFETNNIDVLMKSLVE